MLFQGIESLIGHNPGPFAGSVTPSGGFFGGGERPVENTEIINNYYDQPDPNQPDARSSGGADQNVYSNTDPDPDPDPMVTNDFASDSNDDVGGDLGGGDDTSYV